MINWKTWSFTVSNDVRDYSEIRKELCDKGLNFLDIRHADHFASLSNKWLYALNSPCFLRIYGTVCHMCGIRRRFYTSNGRDISTRFGGRKIV